MNNATINIYVPTYEPKPDHLRKALECIKSQTFCDWTVLIHDDASPKTNVREIVGPYLSDPRIVFKQSGQRRGIGGNWNACAKHGKAPYVQYLFQDDLWEPEYLQKSMEALQSDAGLAFCAANHYYRDDDGNDIGGRYGEIKQMRDQLFTGRRGGKEFLLHWIHQGLAPNLIGEPSFVLMRRTNMEQAGPFAEDMPQFLDVEYWMRLLLTGDWYGIGENVGSFRVHPDGASARNERTGQGMFDRFRCFQRLIGMLQGQERSIAIRARNDSLEQMIDKFLLRLLNRKHVAGGGKKTAALTAKDYPILLMGLLRYVIRAPWRLLKRKA
jgi:glycosyltransferase involved in cell wall biosynthesis